MKGKNIYPSIDMIKTGELLKRKVIDNGITVKEIQEYLHLSCPQPVYRWFKGRILPSVDHLLMLSELLGVHMEELLVKKNEIVPENYMINYYGMENRIKSYALKLKLFRAA